MQTILFKVFVVVGISALALIAAVGLRHQFADFHEFVQRTPKWQGAFLALLAAVARRQMFLHARTKGLSLMQTVRHGSQSSDGLESGEPMTCIACTGE